MESVAIVWRPKVATGADSAERGTAAEVYAPYAEISTLPWLFGDISGLRAGGERSYNAPEVDVRFGESRWSAPAWSLPGSPNSANFDSASMPAPTDVGAGGIAEVGPVVEEALGDLVDLDAVGDVVRGLGNSDSGSGSGGGIDVGDDAGKVVGIGLLIVVAALLVVVVVCAGIFTTIAIVRSTARNYARERLHEMSPGMRLNGRLV